MQVDGARIILCIIFLSTTTMPQFKKSRLYSTIYSVCLLEYWYLRLIYYLTKNNIASYPDEQNTFYSGHGDGAYNVEAYFLTYLTFEILFEFLWRRSLLRPCS
jgi:hypothetical protein